MLMALRKLSVSVRLWGLGGLRFALLGLQGAACYIAYRGLRQGQTEQWRQRRTSALTADLRALSLHLRRFEKDMFLNVKDSNVVQSYWAKWLDIAKRAEADLLELGRLAPSEEHAFVAQVQTELDAYVRAVRSVHARLGGTGGDALLDPAAANEAITPFKNHVRGVEVALDAFVKSIEKRAQEQRLQSDDESEKAQLTVGLLFALTTVSGAGLFVLVGRSLVKPYKKTLLALNEIQSGDRTARIHDYGADEFRTIADAVDDTLDQVLAAEADVWRRTMAMREVLGVVDEATLVINRDGSLGEERSAAFDRWFGGPEEGEPMRDVIARICPAVASEVDRVWARLDALDPREPQQ